MEITISNEYRSEEIFLNLDTFDKLSELDKTSSVFVDALIDLNLYADTIFNFTKGCMFVSNYLRKKNIPKIVNPPSPLLLCKFNFVYPIGFKFVGFNFSLFEVELEVLRLDLIRPGDFELELKSNLCHVRGPVDIVKFSFDRFDRDYNNDYSTESNILFSVLMDMYNELDTFD